jgi:uncharacterized membrane protein
METAKKQFPLSISRLQTLVDGIFAIAMTILVFNIKLPEGNHVTDVRSVLTTLWPTFWSFAQSFLLLGAFWSSHHRQGHLVREANQGLVWMNIIWLMFVVLVPFSTSLLSLPNNLLGTIFFDVNLFAVGLLSSLTWRYTVSHGLVHDEQKRIVVATTRRTLVFPVAALIALGFAFISPAWSNLCYLLVPVGLWGVRPKHQAGKAEGDRDH